MRTVTFTMEDALISPAGLMILTGAGLIDASEEKTIKVHTTEQTDNITITGEGDSKVVNITLESEPYTKAGEDYIYVMLLDDHGDICSEPYIPAEVNGKVITLKGSWTDAGRAASHQARGNDLSDFVEGSIVFVDYYVERESGVSQIEITPDKFGGYYYLEASTLFRTQDGIDMPAEFIVPNCKIQSNFSFSLAGSGDPSTFTFTIDAFPDYTRFDRTQKVLATIQMVTEAEGSADLARVSTYSLDKEDSNGMIEGTRPFAGFSKEE